MPQQVAPAEGGRESTLRFLLPAIVLVSAIPLVFLTLTQRVEYDGYWNAFVATQDRWSRFMAHYREMPHPPLYFLLLRMALWFGRSHLAYRAVSLLAGLGTVYLVGRVASRLTRSAWAAALAALAYGVATPFMSVSLEARGYILCTFFLLLSYCWFLDLLVRENEGVTLKLRIGFATMAIQACLSEYYTFFFVAAVAPLALLVALARNRGSRLHALTREIATFAPVLAVMAFLFSSHGRAVAQIYGSLRPYYYDASGNESIGGFLLRNLYNDFNLLSPWPVENQLVALGIVAGLLAVTGAAWWVLRRKGDAKNVAAGATALATILIGIQFMLFGVLHKHPFGGQLRQQFLMFPFVLLCVFALLDRLVSAAPRAVAWSVAGALAAAILTIGYLRFQAFPRVPETLGSSQMRDFERLFPAPAAVFVDEYNLYWFFMHHDDWKWESQGPIPGVPNVDVYRLSRGDRRILLLADPHRWVLEYNDGTLYDELKQCLRWEGLGSVDILRIGQDEGAMLSQAESQSYRERSTAMAVSHEMCLQQLAFGEGRVYAEVRTGRCDTEVGGSAPKLVGTLR